jgi:hypothetical protein
MWSRRDVVGLLSNNVVSFSRNVVLSGPWFSINMVRKSRMLSVRAIYVLSSLHLILNGASVDDVCRSFPDLSRAQVYECLAYYEDHRTQIGALVAEQMSEELR